METTKKSVDKNKENSHSISKKFYIDIFYLGEEILSKKTITISYKDNLYMLKQNDMKITAVSLECVIILVGQMLLKDLSTLFEKQNSTILNWNLIGIFVDPFGYVWNCEMNDVSDKYKTGLIQKNDISERDVLYLKSIQKKLIHWLTVIKECHHN